MTLTLKQARQLVARIETAQRTGTGDIRSNEVIGQLLAIAKLWIAEQPKNGAGTDRFAVAESQLHIRGPDQRQLRPDG